MQPINENDVLEVVVEGTNELTPWAWVSHWMVNTVSTPLDFLSALSTFIKTTWLDNVKELLTDDWQAECLSISRVAPQPMNVYFDGSDFPKVGEVATDGIPNTSAVVIRFTTDEIGPRRRGRMYLPGWAEANTNGGLITPTPTATLDGFLSGLIAGMSDGGESANLCIFSRTAYNPAADPPQAASVYAAAVTAYDVQYNLGTIRRRRSPRSTPAS